MRDTVAFRHASSGGLLVHKVGSAAGKMAWLDYEVVLRELLELAGDHSVKA
ncbi:hypothetical protein [Deinococcus rubellus]|uniref:hypothetical protein n=1 Tax=Deinococcus rubellus TaxID=1889240 RepID=UPI0031F09BBE